MPTRVSPTGLLVHRLLLAAALASLAALPASAQKAFVAPSSSTILGTAEATSAVAPTRQFFIVNRSSVPIIVYSLDFTSCVNVRQACESRAIHVPIPPGGRATIGRIDAKERGTRYTYEWTYQFHVDTTDARVVAAMAQGLVEHPRTSSENVATPAEAPGLPDATPSAAGAPITETERQTKVVALDQQNRPIAMTDRYRFRVARGSILGATQTPGAEPMVTGACINPAELALLEADTTISRGPATPPQLSETGIVLPTLPSELRAANAVGASVTVRWVVDTTGSTVPGSVSVRESRNALLSVQMCGAVIAAHASPGRDASGRPVRTWVQAPIRIAP